MANIKDFIKKIGNETVSLEEQQKALAAVEQTIVEAKAKREESIGKNVDLVISALKKIESDLNTKLVELNNTPAKQGVAGPQGEKGRDGRDGTDGYKGQDGKDGVDGKDGKDGEDGISVSDAKVDFDGSLVITLSDGREIDAGTVVSLDVAKNIHSVQTGGTGSTSQAVLDAIAAIQATIATYGTMATQNANAVAITGGTINGTTVGATTPSSIVGTTITGQTGVLRGTGQNFLLQSQTFDNASWTKANATVTANSTVAPDGTTTADTVLADGASGVHSVAQSPSFVTGLTYTYSAFIKAGTNNFAQLRTVAAVVTQGFANFDLSTGSLGTVGAGVTASITSVGNSWYRCSITFTSITTGAQPVNALVVTSGTSVSNESNTLATSIILWGAQLEIGSTANTYIPTTTTAIYGTPTLSFSGVAGLGLQSDGALYVSPAGTGALQAQATTSTTAGGNARGANAVDWQTSRTAASQVASAANTFIGGGSQNTASGQYATVAGGVANTASSFVSSAIAGWGNTVSGQLSSIVGGYLNTTAGYYNFVGGGYSNSGTANAAVTTQSGTMNATTAVTLSGSNASIKVGQLITGTSIASYTYVAAISGTSLTLSQAASGSSTSTLSFYTPHGVVVGGGNNQATGSYSFIGGGGDAGTAANRNVASGDWSFVGGGRNNIASGIGSVVVGGGLDGSSSALGNTASGTASIVGGGLASSASATGSSILGGYQHQANGNMSSILGGRYGTTRGILGNFVFPINAIADASGVSQAALLVIGAATTDATATALRSNTGAASGTNQVILPNNSAYFFTGEVVSGKTAGGDTKGWTIEGVIKRGANPASTALVGTPTVTSMYADVGAATWAIAVTADTTNGGIRVTFTGQASTTIRTVCQIRTTEMTY